jgi:hypothetical protein
LAADTSADIERRQIAAWRQMTPAQKAALISAASSTARDMAMAGIRHRFPNASPHEHFLRLAMLTLGPELARRAYPEIVSLGLE